MSNKNVSTEALRAGEGVVRLAPCWVPRSFLMPGGRLKLDPRDLYALGAHRGGIDERWFSSTTKAANGPLTAEDEGLSYLEFNGGKVLLKEAIETVGDQYLGSDVMERYGGFNLLCKFFDNLGPIPHHLHQNDEFAARVRQKGKPEAYYFPPKYNFKGNNPRWMNASPASFSISTTSLAKVNRAIPNSSQISAEECPSRKWSRNSR